MRNYFVLKSNNNLANLLSGLIHKRKSETFYCCLKILQKEKNE